MPDIKQLVTHGLFVCLGLSAFAGCTVRQENEVVVYAALDEEFSRPVLEQFSERTGIAVRAKYDVESTKTVGLTNALIAEAARPRCDLFWNNEILNTLRLDRRGLLQTYDYPQKARYAPSFYSANGTWYGFAARARILIVNTEHLPDESDRPSSVMELADPRWQGKVAIAKPLFGTTASHATVLFHKLGPRRAKEFFRQVRSNADVLSGNKQVALSVAAGQYDWGLTDTDDAFIEIDKGKPVAIVFPDQGEDELGALLIPNTLALIKSGPNSDNMQRLVDYLLSAEVEEQLAAAPSGQFPLARDTKKVPRKEVPDDLKVMEVDFPAAAAMWGEAAEFLRDEFMTAEAAP